MFNLNDFTSKFNEDDNKHRSYIPNHSYRMFIIGGFGSGKINSLLNLIKEKYSDNLCTRFICMLKN